MLFLVGKNQTAVYELDRNEIRQQQAITQLTLLFSHP